MKSKSVVKYPQVPYGNTVVVATKAKVMALRYPKHLEVWKLGEASTKEVGKPGSLLPLTSDPVKVLQLQTKDDETIRCCHLSDDGSWIGYATPTRIRVYSLKDVEGNNPDIHRASVKSEATQLAHHLRFYGDGKMLSITDQGSLQLFEIDNHCVVLTDTVARESLGLQSGVSKIEIRGDYCAIADFSGHVICFDLGEKKPVCKAPLYNDAPVSCLSIHPKKDQFIVVYTDNHIVEVNIANGKYTKFSNALKMPKDWKNKKHPTIGIIQDGDDKIIMYDHVKIFSLDRSNSTLSSSSREPPSKKKTATLIDQEPEQKIKVTKKFENLVFFGPVESSLKSLMAVEVKPQTIEDQLPPSLKMKKFGAM